MKLKNFTVTLCKKVLAESVSPETMERFARLVNPDYDVYMRSGMPRTIPITNQGAANQIVNDFLADGRFVDLVEALIKVEAAGYMGKAYTIKHLGSLVKTLVKEGFVFDSSSGQFVENSMERISPNWGRLLEGDERLAAVLRLDVAASSALVKRNDAAQVDKVYAKLRSIVHGAVVSRSGRVWSWEGDGALAAFVFGQKERAALMAGMEILNELFFYNRLESPLPEPLHVRIAAHAGPIWYSSDIKGLLKNETVKETVQIEAKATNIDSLGVSPGLFMFIDRVMQDRFRREHSSPFGAIREYSVTMEK